MGVLTKLFAILRHKKIGLSGGQWNKVGAANRHNCRIGTPAKNVDSTRTQFNKLILGTIDLTGDIKKRLKALGIKPGRKDSVVLRERVATASMEFFGVDWKEKLKANDIPFKCKLDEWIQANLEFFKKSFGDNVVQATLHLDETTPHIHFMIMPVVPDGPGYKLCAKAEVPGKKTLRKYQDDYANAMQKFGLSRGDYVEETASKHEHHQAYKSRKAIETVAVKLSERNKLLEQKTTNLEQATLFLQNKVVKQDAIMADVNAYINNAVTTQAEALRLQYESELDSIMTSGKRQSALTLQAQPVQAVQVKPLPGRSDPTGSGMGI